VTLAGNRVLLIGFDPHTVPELDDALVRLVDTAIALGEQELQAHGFETTYCLVAPDDQAQPSIAHALTTAV
jgi:hypothetical protein